jgi:hypothetical protein
MYRFLARILVFCVFLAVVLEVFFRTLVPAAEMPRGFQDHEYGVMRLDPSAGRDGVRTMGRLAEPRFRWHLNEAGYDSDWEYLPADQRDHPCVALIGNSYVEGLYSNVEENLAARLQQRLGGRADVYNLGTSGMPLSQTRRVIRMARDRYTPSRYLVFVGSGSLKRSLRANGLAPYAEQLAEDGNSFREIAPSTHRVNSKLRLLWKSALLRYLMFNANVHAAGGTVVAATEDSIHGISAVERDLIVRATDHILAGMVSDVPAEQIVIFVDANRKAMYATNSRPDKLLAGEILAELCPRYGIEVIDLTDAMWREYERTGRQLNFADNYHWNPETVDLVAKTLLEEGDRDLLIGNTR